MGAVDTSATDSFSHAAESASAGYYRVALDNGVTVQLTATTRTGLARFSFPATRQANLVLGLAGSQRSDLETSFKVVSRDRGPGLGQLGQLLRHRVALHRVLRPAVQPALHPERQLRPARSPARAGPGAAALTFDTTAGRPVLAKAGISYVSAANARLNLAAENPGWNFTATRDRTRAAWNSLLGRIQVGGGTAAQQAVFYTALYHSLLDPSVFSDDNRQYRGVDGRVHTVDRRALRLLHGLLGLGHLPAQAQLEALVAPGIASDAAQSMVDDYAQDGMLPKWDAEQQRDLHHGRRPR